MYQYSKDTEELHCQFSVQTSADPRPLSPTAFFRELQGAGWDMLRIGHPRIAPWEAWGQCWSGLSWKPSSLPWSGTNSAGHQGPESSGLRPRPRHHLKLCPASTSTVPAPSSLTAFSREHLLHKILPWSPRSGSVLGEPDSPYYFNLFHPGFCLVSSSEQPFTEFLLCAKYTWRWVQWWAGLFHQGRQGFSPKKSLSDFWENENALENFRKQ